MWQFRYTLRRTYVPETTVHVAQPVFWEQLEVKFVWVTDWRSDDDYVSRVLSAAHSRYHMYSTFFHPWIEIEWNFTMKFADSSFVCIHTWCLTQQLMEARNECKSSKFPKNTFFFNFKYLFNKSRYRIFLNVIYSPFFPLQNAVYFIIITYLVPVLFKFYIQGVLKLKK